MSDDDEEWKVETKAAPSAGRPSLDPECILPYAGVKEDVEALLSRVRLEFDRERMLGFDLFAEHFRDMKFSLIFSGRQSFRELHEFVEELLSVALSNCLEPHSFGRRVAGLFLVYAIFLKQPVVPKVRVRIVHEEYKQLLATVEECRQERHFDVVYCWTKLVAAHAFRHVAQSSVLGFETFFAREARECANATLKDSGRVEWEDPFKSEEHTALLADLSKIHNKYTAIKNALKDDGESSHGGGGGASASLSLASDVLPNKLRGISEMAFMSKSERVAAAAHEGVVEDAGGNILMDRAGKSIGDRRQALRDRAFQKVRDKTRNEAEFETLVEAAAAEAKAEAEAAAEDEDDEDYEKAAKKSRRKKGSGKKGKTKLKGKGKGKRKKNTPLKGQ